MSCLMLQYIFEMDLYTCTMALYPRSFVLEYFLPGKLQIRRRAYNWWGGVSLKRHFTVFRMNRKTFFNFRHYWLLSS